MVTGRPHGHERIVGPPSHDFVHGQHRAAARVQHGRHGSAVHDRVGVEAQELPFARSQTQEAVDIGGGMREEDRFSRRLRCLQPPKLAESLGRESPLDGPEAVRALGMTRAHIVSETGWMADQNGGQGVFSLEQRRSDV